MSFDKMRAEISATLENCVRIKSDRGQDLIAALADVQARDSSFGWTLIHVEDHGPERRSLAMGTVTGLGQTLPFSGDGDSPHEAILAGLATGITLLSGFGLEEWLAKDRRAWVPISGSQFVS